MAAAAATRDPRFPPDRCRRSRRADRRDLGACRPTSSSAAPTRSRSAATAWTCAATARAACCLPQVAVEHGFEPREASSPRPAARPASPATPGATPGPRSASSKPRSSATTTPDAAARQDGNRGARTHASASRSSAGAPDPSPRSAWSLTCNQRDSTEGRILIWHCFRNIALIGASCAASWSPLEPRLPSATTVTAPRGCSRPGPRACARRPRRRISNFHERQ